jgi:cysteine-rich repeat protein
VAPPRCGDGQIDADFEECDLGSGNSATGYGGCTTSCEIGPSCGDGTVQDPPETCDDGVNDGFYGSCTPECAPGPRCGDGTLQEEWGEECDSNDPNCRNCRLGAQCGDRVVQSGEECDDGVNDGGYGECGPRCEYGPRCGDGVTNGDEDCDDGEGHNTGGYGRCAPGCVYGPYCGDDRVQSAFEQCDDGNNRNGDNCSSACRNEQSVPK